MNVQVLMKDLRNLKQEEQALANITSKISDQLNRLKVEELALQNLVRHQNEELERKSRGSQRSINRSLPLEGESNKGGDSDLEFEEVNQSREIKFEVDQSNEGMVDVDLEVNAFSGMYEIEENEEEEDEDMMGRTNQQGLMVHDDIEHFVNELC